MKRRYLLILLSVLVVGLVGSTSVFASDLTEVSTDAENLILKVGGADITFEGGSDKIYISEGIKVLQNDNDSLVIKTPRQKKIFNWSWNNEGYEIFIGTEIDFSNIDIDAGGVKVNGLIRADKLDIDAGGIDMDVDIIAEKVFVDGAGTDLEGYIRAEMLEINGAGMDVDIEVEGIQDIILDGVGMSAYIKYMDSWVGTRNLSMDGIGSSLDILIPEENNSDQDGELNIDSDSIGSVDIDYY